MNFPENLKYSKDHEWVQYTESGSALVGISDFAQSQLGALVFVNLPEVGETVEVGERFCDVESVKAVSDVYSPVTGTVKAVNEDLQDSPETINSDPYGAWIAEIEDITATDELMSASEYEAFCKEV
ncbi:MAG: glycine cleavage system protein GcvH [Defluviitaleaceae bacterium]|nr:glycine cleavage system protein GcvH [Defluviitaleaceae bacterium]